MTHQSIRIERPNASSSILDIKSPTEIFLKAGTVIHQGDIRRAYSTDTQIEAKNLLEPGRDYAVHVSDEGVISAELVDANPLEGSAIAGFHFALGGNAIGTEGGDSVPQINPATFWDRGFRPACPDPRGMFLVTMRADASPIAPFWFDIYCLNTDPDKNGTSRAGVQIADGYLNTPEGYDNLNCDTAKEILAKYGKRLPYMEEFFAAAYGVKEFTAASNKPKLTGLDPERTSAGGGMQMTGNLWIWGDDGHPDVPKASIFGGGWGVAAGSGSRASYWDGYPWNSNDNIGARGCSDHLILDGLAR